MKTKLNVQLILDKQFTKDVKGYKASEVDEFLDLVIKDYSNLDSILQSLHNEITRLQRDSGELKLKLSESEIEIAKFKVILGEVKDLKNLNQTSIDMLKRISKLESKLFALGIDPNTL